MELGENFIKLFYSKLKMIGFYIRTKTITQAPHFPALCPFCNFTLTLIEECLVSSKCIILLLSLQALNLER